MKLVLTADLHFGSVVEGLAEILAQAIAAENPGITIIAGDLTLGARRTEFEKAALWLDSLQRPLLVLPGNHDMPYWNLIRRFSDPFRAYSVAANAESLMPAVALPEGLVLGFNTATSWQPHLAWQEGVARRTDIEAAKELLSASGAPFKAVAAHHPFVRIEGQARARPVRRAEQALEVFAEAGVALLMSGHTHMSFAMEHEIENRKIVAVGAPTALSSRMRGEANGFCVIEASPDAIACSLRLYTGSAFEEAANKHFQRSR